MRLKTKTTEEIISTLSRERCETILTSISIQCYDDETTEELREAVWQNVLDGTLQDITE